VNAFSQRRDLVAGHKKRGGAACRQGSKEMMDGVRAYMAWGLFRPQHGVGRAGFQRSNELQADVLEQGVGQETVSDACGIA
jgi:hypothetical protein